MRPCKVTIKGTTYEGCYYRQDTRTCLYLLADSLPACYRRTTKVVFQIEDEVREWYIGGYSGRIGRTPAERRHLEAFRASYGMNTEEHRARYEPFGPYFKLFPWPTGHRMIDAHEERPYTRVPMAVEWPRDDSREFGLHDVDCECATCESSYEESLREHEESLKAACCIIGCTEPARVPYHQWHMCETHAANTTAEG